MISRPHAVSVDRLVDIGDRDAFDAISIHGAREHNLKGLSLIIPRDRFVVITGVSGSGKSTLAFDLLFAEGQRRFLDSMNVYARQFVEQLARPDVDLITGIPSASNSAIPAAAARAPWRQSPKFIIFSACSSRDWERSFAPTARYRWKRRRAMNWGAACERNQRSVVICCSWRRL